VSTVAGLGTLAYALAGYPLLVSAWSLAKGRPQVTDPPLRPVSVVISAHNEARVIGAKLLGIAAGSYPLDQLQVIVSDDGSTDDTVRVVQSVAPWVEIVTAPRRTGKMGAMQRAMERVRHDVVVFTDAENLLGHDSLRELLKPLEDPRVGAVNGAFRPTGGAESVSTGERLYWRYEDAVKHAEANVGSLTSILGALLAVRTELVPPLPAHVINDDFYLGMQVARQGRRVAYAAGAVTWEAGASSLGGDASRRARMTAGRWQTVRHWRQILPTGSPLVMWQVLSHKYLRLLLPVAMGAALLGAAGEVAAGRSDGRSSRWAAGLLWVQLGGYGLAASADVIPRRLGPARAAAQALRYLVRTNLASAEGFWRFLRTPEQLALWDQVEKQPHTDDHLRPVRRIA
jgi:cellulose synthase/poly-beta-1,6-N-acetylglucosamine synthase-like glycosyltransferase